jgi:hypothetical protein
VLGSGSQISVLAWRDRPHLGRARGIASFLFLALVIAGCVGPSVTDGPPAGAPGMQVGDRWVYRGEDGFRQKVVWEETHEVIGIDPAGIRVHIALQNPTLDIQRNELWKAPGTVEVGALMDIETRRFATPLERYRFPLAPGERWNQMLANVNETAHTQGQISRFARVDGWEKVTTPAGTFDALRIRVIMRLDDEEFWRTATECNYLVWYAPEVGAAVREEKQAQYLLKDGQTSVVVRAQYTFLELTSYKRGG